MKYDELVAEALATSFQGWDFAPLSGRVFEDPLPWSYERLLLACLPDAISLLDLGTGGGEFLSKPAPLPARTYRAWSRWSCDALNAARA
ncbi:hypothetical protein GCM10022419_014270 [Nonomuraea rosea]|uniref:Class I SAM-dependent methyltransferase n=1 Tax=Nonomuraea rosea TaxID=638574 RepID=A0ABP6VKR1_9ACTN